MASNFSSVAPSATGPAEVMMLVVPGALPLATPLKALRAGAAGTITLRARGMVADIIHPVLEGEIIIAHITHVTATAPAMTLVGYA